MRRLSIAGRERLKKFEGFRAKAYIPVAGDRLTIGYGFTRGVKPGDTITRGEADLRLQDELVLYERTVEETCTLIPNNNEFDAMVLLCYNIGPGWKGPRRPPGAKNGFRQSTVLKAHNRGDKEAASRAFGLWNLSGGVEYPGLVTRRAQEAALYLRPSAQELAKLEPDAMPQTIDPESKMSESTINRASVVAGGTAAAATVAETVRTAADIKYSAASLGDWVIPLLLIAVVALCAYIILQRYKQRAQGWS